MKRTAIASLLGGALLIAAVLPLQAQPPEEGRFWERMSEKYDTNADGEISREEFTAQSDPFERLDRDEDGVLTAADFAGGPGRGGFFVRQADSDEDGTVSATEWATFLAALDADGDGLIAETELVAVLPQRGPGPREGALQRITGALDRDGDELLESADLTAVFAELDEDGDGNLSEDELPRSRRPFHHRGHRGHGKGMYAKAVHGAHLLIAADRQGDADGTVSRGEWDSFLATLDGNGDGVITGEELEAARPADAPPRPDNRPPRDVELTVDKLAGLFDRLDDDQDQLVSRDELPFRRHRERGPRG